MGENELLLPALTKIASSAPACHLIYLFARVFALTSHWIIVLIAAERFICVWMYYKAKKLYTAKTAGVCIVCICGMAVLCVSVLVGTSTAMNGQCITPGWVLFQTRYWMMPILFMVVYLPLPLVLLAIFNLLTAGKLWHKHSAGGGNMKQANLTTMLLTTTALFMLLTTPHCVLQLPRVNSKLSSHTWIHLADVMLSTNYAINFFVYGLIGQKFRKELVKMFRCGKPNIIRPQVDNLQNQPMPLVPLPVNTAQQTGTQQTTG
jgi:hypothetical protein